MRKQCLPILVILSLLLGIFPAQAQSSPYFEANVTGNSIQANEFMPGSEVTVKVYEGELPSTERFSAKLTTDEDGSAWFDFWEKELYPWNYVEVTDGPNTKGLIIQPLTLDLFDPEAEIIAGTASPGALVRADVWVDESDNASLEVTTDTDGNWVADFSTFEPDGYDVNPDAWYAAFIIDGDGDATMAELTPPPPPPPVPWLEANITTSWIEVFEFSPSTEVTISVYDSPGAETPFCEETPTTDEYGFAHIECWVTPFTPGNLVVMTDGVVIKDLMLAPLSIELFDHENDVIAGTAEPEAFVLINVYNPPPEDTFASLDVMADLDGNWIAEFTDFPIYPDAWYMAYVFDDDGDATTAELLPPPEIPYILAWPAWNWVDGFGFPLGAEVLLIIDDDHDPSNPPLYTTTGLVEPTPWNPDDTVVGFDLGGIVDLQLGHTVVLIYEDLVKVHDVTSLEIISADPFGDLVIGNAEPFSGVDLWAHGVPETDVFAEVNNEGLWVADFAGVYDIVPGSAGIAAQFDDDGDATFVEWFVVSPGWIMDLIQAMVDNEDIAPELQNSLKAKIASAMSSLDTGKFNPAIRKLHAFIHEVEAQRGKKIDDIAADVLIGHALDMIAQLEGA